MKPLLNFRNFLLFILILISNQTFAQLSNFVFENIGIKEGLSQSQINVIYQDKKGFIWFGTQDGLNRYDGYNFKIFRPDFENPEKSINIGYILNIQEDNFGNILIGTLAGGLNIYDPVNEKFYYFKNDPENKNSISGNNAKFIHTDTKNNIWMMNENGFSKLTFPVENNFDSVIVYNFDTFLGISPNKFSSYPFIDKNNNLTIFYDGKIYFFDKNDTDFENYTFENLPENSFQIRKEAKNIINTGYDYYKNIWILYNDSLEKITDVKNNKSEVYYYTNNKNIEFTDMFIVGRDSCVYSPTKYFGMPIINLKTHQADIILNETSNIKSLFSNNINWFIEDSKGVFWIGTNLGISKYSPRKNFFKHFYSKPNDQNWLHDNMVFSLGEDKYGNIWIGILNGKGLYIYDKKNNTFKNISPANSPGSNHYSNNVFSFFKDNNDQVWIGTYGGGLAKYNEKTNNFTFFQNNPKDSTSISNNVIYSFAEDKNGYLWIGTSNGLNKFDKNTQKFEYYCLPQTVNANITVTSIIINDDGSLWLGSHGNGLFNLHFENNKPIFKNYVSDLKDSTSLSVNQIFTMIKDKNGDLWISTAGGGINKFDVKTEKFKRYTVKNGLSNNFAYGLLFDNFDRIWISTNFGLSVLDTKTEKFKNYTVNQGLQSNEFNQGAFFKDSEGLMYFGGVNGYNVFNPNTIAVDTITAEVIFTDFKLFNKSVVPGENSPLKKSIAYADEIILEYWQSDFSFEFCSNNFSSPSDNMFSYMIENYNNTWVDNGTNHSISFAGFQPGNYVLKVKTANSDGVWSENPTSISLIIRPPFWKTTWFVILEIIILVFLIFIFIRLRTRKLKKDKQILEQKVVERTAEIQKQKSEILEKNEELHLLNEEISTQRDNLQELNEELKSKNEEISTQRNNLQELNEELKSKNEEISTQRNNLQELNEELTVKNDEINNQKDEIERKNVSITSSIQYAQRIQKAVFPSLNILDSNFEQNFILFKPKDIVSGDFYFVKQHADIIYIAAADCTGHGVPGAFMSMLGISFLNEIVSKTEIPNSGEILNELRNQIKNSLQQTGQTGEQQDGMDIAFCSINVKTLEMSFAGAHNPCWIFRNENQKVKNENFEENELFTFNYKLLTLEADRQPVGIFLKEKPFTEQKFQLQKGDFFYLFSDGYVSQFGGEKNEKFKTTKLKQILSEICQIDLNEQKQIIENKFNEWKASTEQTDDVLIMGVKI